MKMNNNSIGNNIRKWRVIKGFKQDVFAKKIGISKATLSKIENEKQSVNLVRLQKIAFCLQLKMTHLFYDPSDLLDNYRNLSESEA